MEKRTPLRLLAGASLLLALGVTGRQAHAQGLNQPPRGFTALFNGRDLTNWQGLIDIKTRATLSPDARKARQAEADRKMREQWKVENGILVFDGKGDSLQTIKDYGNFELYVDWRILPGGDSGIYLRGNPQVQIWDREIGSGGLFNNQKHPSGPLVVADRPVGQWNTFWIRMVGDRVTITLNDQIVVMNTPLENYWFRGQPLPRRGPIELQNHGNRLEFRNIFIAELPDDLSASAAARLEARPLAAGAAQSAPGPRDRDRARPSAAARALALRLIRR